MILSPPPALFLWCFLGPFDFRFSMSGSGEGSHTCWLSWSWGHHAQFFCNMHFYIFLISSNFQFLDFFYHFCHAIRTTFTSAALLPLAPNQNLAGSALMAEVREAILTSLMYQLPSLLTTPFLTSVLLSMMWPFGNKRDKPTCGISNSCLFTPAIILVIHTNLLSTSMTCAFPGDYPICPKQWLLGTGIIKEIW